MPQIEIKDKYTLIETMQNIRSQVRTEAMSLPTTVQKDKLYWAIDMLDDVIAKMIQL